MTKNQVSLRQSIGCLDLTFKVNITPYSAGLKISQKIKKIKKKRKIGMVYFLPFNFFHLVYDLLFSFFKKKNSYQGKRSKMIFSTIQYWDSYIENRKI